MLGRRNTFSSGLGFIAAAAMLMACQPKQQTNKSLTIEDAKRITTRFGGDQFVPPPRTITDVLAIVRTNHPKAMSRRQEMRKVSVSSPPQSTSRIELAKFYRARANAHAFLGQVAAQLADLKHAENYAQGDRELSASVNGHLGVAHTHAGNYRLGLEYRRRSVALTPVTSGRIIARSSALGSFEAFLGDLESAKRRLEIAKKYAKNIPYWESGREWGGLNIAFLGIREGEIRFAQGRYNQAAELARRSIEVSRSEIESNVTGEDVGWILSDLLHWAHAASNRLLAQALLQQGRLAEAEIAARNAVEISVSNRGRLSVLTTQVLITLSSVLLEQGRIQDAEKISKETIAIYREMGVSGNSLFLVQARMRLAETLFAQRKWQDVVGIFKKIELDLTNDRDIFEHAVQGSASWAIADIVIGNPELATARLQSVYSDRINNLGPNHILTSETGGLLASARFATGALSEALVIFEHVLPVLSSSSRDSAEEGITRTARDLRISFILESYLEALAANDPDSRLAVEKAFRVAAIAQGRTVQRAVLASASRTTALDPDLADLVRREQDTRKQIGALYGTLANMMSVAPDRRDASGENQVRHRVDQLRIARAALAEEIEDRYPEYKALVNPRPPSITEIRAKLSPDEALIVTFVGLRGSYVWAVPKQGFARFRRISIERQQVSTAVQELREALDPNAETLDDIPAFDTSLAHDLYRSFLGPVKDGWAQAENLLVVADGPLGQIPFGLLVTKNHSLGDDHALFDGYRSVPWLIRDRAVTTLPSPASLVALRSTAVGDAGRQPFVGFGDPIFVETNTSATEPQGPPQTATSTALKARGTRLSLRSPVQTRGIDSAELSSLPRLPETAEEIKAIALALKADQTQDVFLGLEANEERVKNTDLSRYRVIAFATHGLVPGDLNGLTQPALALSSPAATGGAGDGLLVMDEILALRLNADWVLLSACNTGSAQSEGADAISGLGRAFFYAGARSLLVSNWPVETTSARTLTTEIFRRQAADPKLGRAKALQQSMVSMIDGPGSRDSEGRTLFSYAHPIFWAPFTLIGDGGIAP
jgi:CHAT domain-containing protein